MAPEEAMSGALMEGRSPLMVIAHSSLEAVPGSGVALKPFPPEARRPVAACTDCLLQGPGGEAEDVKLRCCI